MENHKHAPTLCGEDRRLILEGNESLWEQLRGRRIFVTGGTGFVGTWLLQSFAWANQEFRLGAKAVVLSRNWTAFCAKAPQLAADPAISCHAGDVRDFEFPDGEFSHVIHAVTEESGKLNDEASLPMLDTVIGGTRRTLEFACSRGATRFFMVSSGAMYGRQPPDMTHIPENYSGAPDPLDYRSAYAQSKRVAEHLGAIYARRNGLEVAIARGFAFVGPYLLLSARYAIGNFIRDGLNGGPIMVQGDGTALRSYLYAADMALWLWNIFLRGPSCRPYNVGSEEAVSIADLAHLVADYFQPRREVRIQQAPAPGKQPDRYIPCCERAQNELALRQNVDLREAIRRTIKWHAL